MKYKLSTTWKGSETVFSSCFYLFLSLLTFTHVLENIHEKAERTDFTGRSTAWRHRAQGCCGHLEETNLVRLHSSEPQRGEIIADGCASPQTGGQRPSPGPQFSCIHKYSGFFPLADYCQCWVTSLFPLCGITSFYVCAALQGSTCLCCFPHFL